jgi:ABC-type sugar transport system substrate-binding protein
MNRIPSISLTALLLALAVVGSAAPAAAQTTVEVTYVWTAPSTGSPVDHYVVEHSVNGGGYSQVATTAGTTYTLIATVGDSHQIRVRGVDAEDRHGPNSLPSEPYVPDIGPPGQPGQPILF